MDPFKAAQQQSQEGPSTDPSERNGRNYTFFKYDASCLGSPSSASQRSDWCQAGSIIAFAQPTRFFMQARLVGLSDPDDREVSARGVPHPLSTSLNQGPKTGKVVASSVFDDGGMVSVCSWILDRDVL